MWILIIIVSAMNGFGGNTEGGVAIQSVRFKSQAACEAAQQKITLNTHIFYREVYCMEDK